MPFICSIGLLCIVSQSVDLLCAVFAFVLNMYVRFIFLRSSRGIEAHHVCATRQGGE